MHSIQIIFAETKGPYEILFDDKERAEAEFEKLKAVVGFDPYQGKDQPKQHTIKGDFEHAVVVPASIWAIACFDPNVVNEANRRGRTMARGFQMEDYDMQCSIAAKHGLKG